jgi:hypothetical protein
MKLRFGLLAIGVIAAGWALWHYREFRACGERSCTPPEGEPGIRLESGREVPVLSTHLNEGRDLVINYLTSHDREDTPALCAEAEEVWDEVRKKLDTRRMERAVLSPTSPESEFLGMKYVVVPLYTCCVSTHLRVEKDRSGSWVFPQCPG